MATLNPGNLRERLTIQRNVWPTLTIALVQAAGLAAAATSAPHGFVSGDYVTIAGATPSGYNGQVQITVTGAQTFTYSVNAGLASPATGAPTVTFVTDAHGAQRDNWTTFTTIRGQFIPVGASKIQREGLNDGAITATLDIRFRVRRRADITPAMRAIWTPSWPKAAPAVALEIHGVLPEDDGRITMFLDAGVLT